MDAPLQIIGEYRQWRRQDGLAAWLPEDAPALQSLTPEERARMIASVDKCAVVHAALRGADEGDWRRIEIARRDHAFIKIQQVVGVRLSEVETRLDQMLGQLQEFRETLDLTDRVQAQCWRLFDEVEHLPDPKSLIREADFDTRSNIYPVVTWLIARFHRARQRTKERPEDLAAKDAARTVSAFDYLCEDCAVIAEYMRIDVTASRTPPDDLRPSDFQYLVWAVFQSIPTILTFPPNSTVESLAGGSMPLRDNIGLRDEISSTFCNAVVEARKNFRPRPRSNA